MDPIPLAESSLRKALTFYADQGVYLSYVPTIEYRNGIHPANYRTIAEAKAETELVKKIHAFTQNNLARKIWACHGIQVSQEAIDEICIAVEKKVEQMSIDEDSPYDITLYRRFTEAADEKDRDMVLGHELWHLIEKEKGVLSSHILVAEGTAVYASMRFVDENMALPLEKCKGFSEIFYYGAAYLFQEELGRDAPLTALFDMQVRKSVYEQLLVAVYENLDILVDDIRNDPLRLLMQGMALKEFPEFKNLDGHLTAKNFIKTYQKLGATMLVRELKGQDLTKILELYRQMGFQ